MARERFVLLVQAFTAATSTNLRSASARGERVPSDNEDGSNRTAASTDPVCDQWDRMRKTESRPRLKFFLAARIC